MEKTSKVIFNTEGSMPREHKKVLRLYAGGTLVLFSLLLVARAYYGLLSSPSIHLGVAVGAVLGIAGSLYLQLTWKTRMAKGQAALENPPNTGCLLPLMVALGTVLGGYVLRPLQLDIKEAFMFAFFAFFIVCAAFILLKTTVTATSE